MLVLAAGAAAADPEPPVFRERNVQPFPTWLQMVPPEFPAEAVREKRSGVVNVEGVVDPSHGQLKNWKLRAKSEGGEPFVKAVEAVIGQWHFNRGTKDCMPVDAPLATKVIFEWDGDNPRVRTLQPSADPSYTRPPGWAAVKQVAASFPPGLAPRGVTASVFARMRVEADGVVSSVDVATYPPEYPDLRKAFGEAARAALLQWRYPQRAEGAWRNCVVINFVVKAHDVQVFRDTTLATAGSPGRTIKPDYPHEALARKEGGFVDLEALLLRDGKLENVRLTPADEASRAFVPALRDVLHLWRFNREIGPDCFPVEAPISARVWFEPVGDEGRVSVSTPGRPATPNIAARPAARNNPQPAYPSTMLRKNLQADVYAQLNVRDDGVVESVHTQVYPRQDPSVERHFGAAVESTLQEWRFEPRAAGPWRYCTVVNFRIRD
jgi:hypothetical protein